MSHGSSLLAMFSPEEQRVRERLAELYHGSKLMAAEDAVRELCVTPWAGTYSGPAGFVIAVSGSPPRGTFVVTLRTGIQDVYGIDHGHARNLTRRRGRGALKLIEAVDEFLKARGALPGIVAGDAT